MKMSDLREGAASWFLAQRWAWGESSGRSIESLRSQQASSQAEPPILIVT